MSIVYYLFLQDRIEEALGRFAAIDPPHSRRVCSMITSAATLPFTRRSSPMPAPSRAATPHTRWSAGESFSEV
jgi:hypothetical protein